MLAQIGMVLLVGFLGWIYKATQPPPPNLCGSPNGPPVASPKIKPSDRRYLSYKERGVPKEEAKYKIIVELIEELGGYLLSFNIAEYRENDPNQMRSVKSEAFDIQELADQLEIGSKFYLIGVSMGGNLSGATGKLPWIRHHKVSDGGNMIVFETVYVNAILKQLLLGVDPSSMIAGMSLVVPVVNYWWPSFPANLSRMKWLPRLAIHEGNPAILSSKDKETWKKILATPQPYKKATQQGVFESLHKDLVICFGSWEFDPMELKNPFPNNESSVYLWQGYEDKLIPFSLQRYVSRKLPWIRYHEVPDGGHTFLRN
ncbi:hypothetical protein GIB67_012852 [Kingdonia uniflora]|uniref:AB hydrolase-1 domain-containing protein n=1 Tax=Kingdonia uniflora TaxID=39325 RepID=A0A7J7NFJ1_9MAGN|nr:hypothetical protein GIB67_012852 [Kingdonia uniflora]